MSSAFDRSRQESLARAIKEKKTRTERAAQSNPRGGLLEFIRYFWDVLEPVDPFVEGWPLECLCAHLEAITRGDTIVIEGVERKFNRLLANVPPGFMKSMTVNVFWPAWEWGPMGLPHLRYVAFSYASDLTERDNRKFRDLVCSRQYRELWGHVFTVVGDGQVRVTNNKTGFKFASSLTGIGTGERGHRVLADDLNKVKGTQETQEAREAVATWAREAMQNRLNDLARDAIIVIQQRLNEGDVSGTILKHLRRQYCALAIPMEYEPGRYFSDYKGWNGGRDPRQRQGQLAWPNRYKGEDLESFKANSYLWAGQYQQTPVPRGGGIFKESWWHVQEMRRKEAGGPLRFVPDVQPIYVLASVDTAFSEHEESDYSAFTAWIVYDDPKSKFRRIMLVDAWQKMLPELSGEAVERLPGESEAAWRRRAQPKWGLVEWIDYSCRRARVNTLIVENKNRAPDVVRTLRRLFQSRDYGIEAIDIRGDKWGRANALVDIFTDGMIYAPAEVVENPDTGATDVRFLPFAEEAIREISVFPRGVHDDLVDSMTLALKYLRDRGWAVRKEEFRSMERELATRGHTKRESIYGA